MKPHPKPPPRPPKEKKPLKRTPLKRVPSTKKKISYGRAEIEQYSKARIKKDLDIVFSIWTRMKSADENGMTTCISCQKIKHYHDLQNGHYMTRALAPALIFNEMNTHAQCAYCNRNEGNRLAYRRVLIKIYGQEKIELLESMQHRKSWIGLFELKILLLQYIDKFKKECKRLNHTPNTTEQRVLNRWSK